MSNIPNGTFGIAREDVLSNSKLRQVFTPHTPINLRDHFFGREREVSQIVSVINSPGQHVLLYGDRGVGKTSLATVAFQLIKDMRVATGKFYKKSCCSEDTFESLFLSPLKDVGYDLEIVGEESELVEGGSGKLKAVLAEGGVESRRSKKLKKVPRTYFESPAWIAEKLRTANGLFLIDEADALSRKKDKKRIAELVKLLSDNQSRFKLIVVGIAETGEELTAGHPSVERCLKETHLSRMPDSAVKEIVRGGMRELQLIPSDEVVDRIVNISSGFPHYTHLICLKCAEIAILKGIKHISKKLLNIALDEAVVDSEGIIRRRYENTLRGAKHVLEYKFLLYAAANLQTVEVSLSSIKLVLKKLLKVDIEGRLVSRYMTNMVEDGAKGVFSRVGVGIYKFSDPRMLSYIKMAIKDLPVSSEGDLNA